MIVLEVHRNDIFSIQGVGFMKVGIIVYSQTGNTLSVALRLEEAMKASGHTVNIVRVEPENDKVSAPVIKLKSVPDVSPYDVIIFASPVQGFSLAPVMKMYLSKVSGLNGKIVYCYVTQQLKKNWMGGNRAIKQITAACKAKGADIQSSGVVNWSSSIREEQISDIVNRFLTV